MPYHVTIFLNVPSMLEKVSLFHFLGIEFYIHPLNQACHWYCPNTLYSFISLLLDPSKTEKIKASHSEVNLAVSSSGSYNFVLHILKLCYWLHTSLSLLCPVN